jgi:predicted O-methyltransferase YrrM
MTRFTDASHACELVPAAAGGTAFERIDAVLSCVPQYLAFLDGRLSRQQYSDWMEDCGERVLGDLLNEDQRNLSTRLRADDRRYVAEILVDLRAAAICHSTQYPERAFDVHRQQVAELTEHGGRVTYIFPEEARLLFALAYILRPRHAAFLGSYYGYWASWALPGIVAAGGRATLVDIDPAVMELAERNLAALGLARHVDFVVGDATGAASARLRDVDLCVLDAEGPKHGADPDLVDKAIYYPIMRAATPAVKPGGVLVAHNMLLENLTTNRYFECSIARNGRQFAKLMPHLAQHYDRGRVYLTTEGVGVFRRGSSESRPAGPCAA